MSTTSQAYGLIPVYNNVGQNRANKYNILNNAGTGYGTSIYKGDLVKVGTDGTIQIGDGPSNCLGVFAGCEYIDANGKPTESNYWPASTPVQTGSQIVAYVYDDVANTTFRVGVTANASSYVQTTVGDQVDIANVGTGSTSTGLSASSITAAPVGSGAGPAQVRVIGFLDGIYDATTNPYPQLLVQIVQGQFLAGAGQAAI